MAGTVQFDQELDDESAEQFVPLHLSLPPFSQSDVLQWPTATPLLPG